MVCCLNFEVREGACVCVFVYVTKTKLRKVSMHTAMQV